LQDAETNALQGFHDQAVVAKPITKFAHRVTNPEEIPRLVAYAYRAANSGIKGPVLLDVPIDVLFTPPHMPRVAHGALTVPPAYPPAPDPAALDVLITAWSAAKRPAVITGTGVRGTDKLLTSLAEGTSTPVFYSNKFSTPISGEHELRGGPATALATLPAAEKPDFVLLLAARTGFLLGGRAGAIIPNKGRVLAQVDLDGSEIGKSHAVEIGIVSDAGLFIQAFLAKAANAPFHRNDAWIQTIQKMKSASLYTKDPKMQPDGQLHPYHAVEAFMRSLPPGSIISIDGGEAGQWASMTAEHAKPKVAMVSTGYLGFLGNGWGYALGAAVADPGRLVVNIHGDGSAGFHIQELDTYARFGLNILTIVVNNFVWGMSVNGQDLIYAGITDARPAIQLSKSCRYEVVAQGFNCASALVTEYDQIQPAVEKLANVGGPGLINMIVSRTPTTPATLSMVGATKDPDVIVVPYYDNVPRAYYKEALSGGVANGH
jgi:thiamine pyrophosphate-dependent acetolactate synthase large subunit-like protein